MPSFFGDLELKVSENYGGGATLAKISGANVKAMFQLGAEKVIDSVAHIPVTVETESGNNATGYVEKSVAEQMDITSVQIPANFAGLESVMVPTRLMDQLFDIIEVREQEEYVEVVAVHMFYRLRQNTTLWEALPETQYTGAAACRNILNNAMFPMGFSVASDCTDTIVGSELDYARRNIVESLLDPENGLCERYGLSLIRDNDRFYCLKNVGYDRGMVIEDGKNLLGVERDENIEDVVTRIAPVGDDGEGNLVWLNYNGLKYVDSPHIGDYVTPKLGILDTGLIIGKDGVTADNIQAKLLAAAQAEFTEKQVDLPSVTMTIQFVSLGDTEEYKQYRNLDKVYLFDILHIKHSVRGYSYAAQVVGAEHDILRGILNSVTIGTPEKWDGVRKVATWQIPEINGDNIRLKSITAGKFRSNAIHGGDIASASIQERHFSQSADGHFKQIFAEELYISNTSEDGLLNTRFTVTEGLISAEVTRAQTAEGTLSGQITVEAGKITQIVSAVGSNGEVTAASIVLAINQSTGQSEAKIDADHVYIGNDKSTTVIAGKLDADDITASFLNAKIATIPTLTGIAASFSGNVSCSGLMAGQVYVGSSAPYTNISDGLAAVQIDGPTNNVYTLQYKRFSDSSWQNAQSFSRATTLSGVWSGATFTVTASPQGDTKATTITLDGGTGGISSPDYTANNFISHKAYVQVKGSQTSGTATVKKILVDATSEYDSGEDSVTASTPERQSGNTFSANKKTVYFNVRSKTSTGKVGSWTQVNADVTESYNAGWNDCLDACDFTGTIFYRWYDVMNVYLRKTDASTTEVHVVAGAKQVPARK